MVCSAFFPSPDGKACFWEYMAEATFLFVGVSEKWVFGREFYNDSVAIFNTRIRQIPDMFVANMLNYTSLEMYKIAESDKASRDVKFEFPN